VRGQAGTIGALGPSGNGRFFLRALPMAVILPGRGGGNITRKGVSRLLQARLIWSSAKGRKPIGRSAIGLAPTANGVSPGARTVGAVAGDAAGGVMRGDLKVVGETLDAGTVGLLARTARPSVAGDLQMR
jgi:hypothetical protein